MISCEDNAVLTCCSRSVVEQSNLVALGGAEVVRFTTVNVHNVCPSSRHKLHELFAQLFSKENTRSNNHSSSRTVILMIQIILNHTNGLATTRGDDDLSFVIRQHGVHCLLLVRAKVDQVVSCSVWIYYSRKPPTRKPSGRSVDWTLSANRLKVALI